MTYQTPPEGWHPFGAHSEDLELLDRAGLTLEFSKELGDDYLPLWEKIIKMPQGRI